MIKDFKVFPSSWGAIQKVQQEGKDWVESVGGGAYTITPIADPLQQHLIYRFEIMEVEK